MLIYYPSELYTNKQSWENTTAKVSLRGKVLYKIIKHDTDSQSSFSPTMREQKFIYAMVISP